MLYRFITSGYTDTLAYVSAFVSAIWIFAAWQYAPLMPGYLAPVSPLYSLAVASFFGALLICKHICLEGSAEEISILNAEKSGVEMTLKSREQTVAELKQRSASLNEEIGALQNKIVVLEENSPDRQLTEMRMKLRVSEEDRKSALLVLVKNLQTRIGMMTEIHDPQLLFAIDVLRQEVDLVENELKRGEISYYELCIKIVDIGEKLSELNDIHLVSSLEQGSKTGTETGTWLDFIRINSNSDPAAVERSFKFFKFAFHPDRFSSDALKVEATRYFQHSINAHNSVKRMENAAP